MSEEGYDSQSKKNPLPKILFSILLIGGIIGYIYISMTGTDIFSIFSDVIPVTKLTFDDPVSGKDIINDLEIIGCDVYEGTLTGYTTISSYNAFLSAVRGKDVLMSQSIEVYKLTSSGGIMTWMPQPQIKLSLKEQVTDIGSINGLFSIHIEKQRFVIQGFTARREVLPPTPGDLKVHYRTIPGREPTLVGTYIFLNNKLTSSYNFSRTSKITPPLTKLLKDPEHSAITEDHIVYPGYFRFLFNINEFSDGQHIIKIIAINVDGINETQTIKFIAVSQPTSASYELGKNSFGTGPYWNYNGGVTEKVSVFGVEDKIRWGGSWYEIIDGTIGAREDVISTRRIDISPME